MPRRSSRIYVHLVVVSEVVVRIMDWGIRRLLWDVAKLIDVKDGSIVLALAMIRQNGDILSMIFGQLGVCVPFLMTSVRSGFFGDTSRPEATSSGWIVILVKYRRLSRILGLATSGTGNLILEVRVGHKAVVALIEQPHA
jgi:hypothetical protein